MTAIQRYELQQIGDEYTLIVYVDPGSEEFSNEFGEITPKSEEKFKQRILIFAKQRFPHGKVTTINVMAGTILLTSLYLGTSGSAMASSPTQPDQPQAVYTVRKTGHSPVLFMVREYPIICTLCHVPLYNTQDTFHPHIFHMQT